MESPYSTQGKGVEKRMFIRGVEKKMFISLESIVRAPAPVMDRNHITYGQMRLPYTDMMRSWKWSQTREHEVWEAVHLMRPTLARIEAGLNRKRARRGCV